MEIVSAGKAALGSAGKRVLALYEQSPVATHRLAEALIELQYRRADARVAENAEWLQIEQRRTANGGVAVMMSEELGLGPREWERQDEIRDTVAPDPWWFPAVRTIRDRPVRRGVRMLRAATQRAGRGWADQDTWNLDSSLCRTLAGQLRHLAVAGHGYPGTDDYQTPQAWAAALITAADGLLEWAQRDESEAADAAGEPHLSDDEFSAALAAWQADEQRRYAAAQQALRWVADNLGLLWD